MAYSETGDGYVGVDDIYAGRLSDGTIIITSGIYSVTTFDSGFADPGAVPTTATITLTGSNTDVTVEDPGHVGYVGTIYVGVSNYGGAGYLNILAGATLTSINEGYDDGSGLIVGGYKNVRIGYGAGSYGKVTVDGVGSSLKAYGAAARISVGRDGGTGELRIENGGFVGTFDLEVGRGDTTSIGRLIIDGAGSTLFASADYGFVGSKYAGTGGYLTFGRGAAGKGYLTVSNAGTLTTQNVDGVSDFPFLRFGRDNGSYGKGLITGTGSSLNLIQIGAADEVNVFGEVGGASLYVGQAGQGILTVASNAQVNVTGDKAKLEVASGRYSSGVPINTTDQSHLIIQSGADVLVDSQGYGGADNGALLSIGRGRETNGKVTVDGSGSTLTVTSSTDLAGDYRSGDIVVGDQGTAQLDVINSGAVYGRELHVAFGAHGLDGGGVEVNTGGYLQTVYSASVGTVNINSGGTVTLISSDYSPYRGVQIADATGTLGTVNVSGAGSTLTSQGGSGVIRVGNYGTGALNLTAGGQANSFFVDIGRSDGGIGTVSVDGAGSKLTASNEFGQFVVNPAEAGFLRLGRNAGSYGKLQVTNGGQVDVKNQYGTISDLPQIIVGRSYGSKGVMEIDGVGSAVNVTLYGSSTDGYAPGSGYYYGPRVRLGQVGGEGLVTVSNGGALNITGEDAELWIGEGTGAAADPSALSSLTIQTGGEVNVTSIGNQFGAHVVVGRRDSGHGVLTIDGTGSILRVSSDNVDDIDSNANAVFGASVVIGREGNGSLAVTNGGAIEIAGDDDFFPGFIVGRGANDGSAAAYGYALVTGAGSSVTVTGTATGSYGSAGFIGAGLRGGSTGHIVISNGGSVINSASNSITQIAANTGSTGTITVDGATSLLDAGTWLTVGANFDFSTGAVLPASGGNGTLTLVSGGQVTAGDVFVGATGTISGDGTINGNVSLLGGTLSASASAGAITINGDISADADATILFEMDGFTGGQFDTLTVSGSATIELSALEIIFPTVGTSPAGTMATLVSAGSLDITNLTTENLLIATFGSVPVEGLSTLDGENQAFMVADTGAALVVEALGQDGGNSTGAVDFGALETAGVDITTVNGFGAGNGGGFDAFALLGVTAISGTASNDNIEMKTTSNVTITGRGGNDTIAGGAGNDLLDGGDDNDELRPGLGADTVLLGAGIDTVVGTLSELSGDSVGDMTAGDRIVISNAEYSILAVRTGAVPHRVEIDADGNGVADTFINLDGDLTGLSFSGGAVDGQTILSVDNAQTVKFALAPGVTETGDYGNKFRKQIDTDGVVNATFLGTAGDLTLSLTGFDIDFNNEVRVLLDGVSLGFLATGLNEGLAQYSFTITAAQQTLGVESTISFVQALDPAFKWGVTDILLEVPTDMDLTLGVTETGDFGNRFNAATDADGVITASFAGTSKDLTLSFTGYDIDFNNEVEVVLNGASLGFLAAGVNDGFSLHEFTIMAAQQVAGQNIIEFTQALDPAFKWGVTDILLEVPTDMGLTLGVTETGDFGNRFNAATDADGVVTASFTGAARDLTLSFTGFDVDFNNEIEVLVNGVSLGFLAAGVNNGTSPHEFTITAAQQVAGQNIIAFNQALNPAFIWGVTDVLLDLVPTDMALTLGAIETGNFGNNFNGTTDADGVVTASFIGTEGDLLLSFTGFDVDFNNEIEVLVNGVSLGFLAAGVNEGTSPYEFIITAAQQNVGENVISFVQSLDPAFKWGVTDVLLDFVPTDMTLTLGAIETGNFGNNFLGTTDADGVVTAAFTGTTGALALSFTGFDVDFNNEIEVLVNGASLGFLAAGVNEGTSPYEFTITAAQQNVGENVISFVQSLDPAFKWGVTDVLIEAAPADMALTIDVTETGDFGNNFNGNFDADGVVTATFTDQGADLLLSFKAYDIDSPTEIEIFLNGDSLGFLPTGVNNALTDQSFMIAAGNQLAVNEIAFVQNDNVAFTWGVTDVLIVEDLI